MKDIKLSEECPSCKANLVLMESVSMPESKLMLVKRCLACNDFPVEEIVEIVTK